jgi:hypothetical protein
MSKIDNFHQHAHWNHNDKYFLFDMGLTNEDREIISSFTIPDEVAPTDLCPADSPPKICDVAQKVVGKLGYTLSDIEVVFSSTETAWHTDGTCRTDELNSLFKKLGNKSEGLFDYAYKLLGECYSKKSSYTCSMALKGAATVVSSVDIKDLTEDCQSSKKLDEKECRKQFEDKLVVIPDGYGICFSSETIHRAPHFNGERIVILTGEEGSAEINNLVTKLMDLDKPENLLGDNAHNSSEYISTELQNDTCGIQNFWDGNEPNSISTFD